MRDLEIPNGMTLYYEDNPDVFDICDECEEPIYQGAMYVVVSGKPICERCIDEGWKTA